VVVVAVSGVEEVVVAIAVEVVSEVVVAVAPPGEQAQRVPRTKVARRASRREAAIRSGYRSEP
jgi:hypothetical protein